jgi:hypothetical protein
MQPPGFQYTGPTDLHRGTAGRLADWLEWHVNALFPQNGIESWYVPQRSPDRGPFLAREDAMPENVHHVACYACDGANEGRYIHVGLFLSDTGYVQVATAKSFGVADECWAIARACSEALAPIFWYREAPVIRDLFLKLPREQTWHRETSLNGPVSVFVASDATVRVETQTGDVLDSVQFDGANRECSTAAYVNDWAAVLRAQGLRVLVKLPDGPQAHAPAVKA